MRRILLAILVVAACGDDKEKHNPDAFVPEDAPADTPVDTPANFCDYSEQHDTTNDYNLASGYAAEDTGIMFTGAASKTICGNMNVGHFDNTNFSIDVDDYTITLTADADVVVALEGQFATVSNVGVFAVDSSMGKSGAGFFLGDHGVFANHLAAGQYHLSVEAYDNADKAAAIPYKVRIIPDNPTTRCPTVTAAANYTEAGDGTLNNGNDMIVVDYSAQPYYKTTAAPTDSPEDTTSMVALTAGMKYRVSGSSASVAAQRVSYFDGDTYLIKTGAATDQLTIRLDWGGTTADLDYFLFFPPSGTTATPIEETAKISTTGPEFKTIAVAPNTSYWLWVGAAAPGSSGLPKPYDASICAEAYTQ